MIGEAARVSGFAFAGVHVGVADDPDAARAVWRSLPDDVVLAILTPAAHAAVHALPGGVDRLCVVMPS